MFEIKISLKILFNFKIFNKIVILNIKEIKINKIIKN